MFKTATLYRMVLPDHTCPYGVHAKSLLQEHGFDVDDRVLQSREEVDAVQQEFGVATTPVVFRGITPDLFKEGSGAVAEGRLDTHGQFVADNILAKHDERYVPPQMDAAVKAKMEGANGNT